MKSSLEKIIARDIKNVQGTVIKSAQFSFCNIANKFLNSAIIFLQL